MPLKSVEVNRTFENTEQGFSGTREFLVFSDRTADVAFTLSEAQQATGVRMNQEDFIFGPRMIPREVSVETNLEGVNEHKVKFKYEPAPNGVPTPGGGGGGGGDTGSGPSEPDYVDFSVTARTVTSDAYREIRSRPGTDSIEEDIVGTPIDSAGEPVTKLLNQLDVQLTIKSSSYRNIPLSRIRSCLGTRNARGFLGFPKGHLLLTGCQVNRDGFSNFNTTITMTYDELAHRRQVPQRNVNGDVILKDNGEADSQKNQAAVVHLIQPFSQETVFQRIGIPDLKIG